MDEHPLAPGFLVAMPQLLDPNFRRSVVLLIHHDENGTFGLVLTRDAEIDTTALCESLGIAWLGAGNAKVGSGGPVQPNTGWLLLGADVSHPEDESDDEATELLPGVHFAGTLATLRRVAAAPPARVRIFLGYAGWAPGQLEAELAQGAWLVASASADAIFDVLPDELWEHVLRSLGLDPGSLIATPGVH